MIFFRRYRICAAQRRLVSLEAKLDAVKKISLNLTTIPGFLLVDLRDIPGQIAETKEQLRQLGAY